MPVKTKRCTKCGAERPLSSFCKRSSSKDGLNSHCADCRTAYFLNHREKNRVALEAKRKKYPSAQPEYKREWMTSYYHANKDRAKDNNLRRFGITLADYERMLDEQGGVCKVCCRPETAILRGHVKALAVDHCHATGVVRGLLCTKCNTALGLVEDCPDRLDALARYLMAHKDVLHELTISFS